MKASKIIIEYVFNKELLYKGFVNTTVLNAIKKIEKEFTGCIIYKVVAEYE